MAKVAPLHSNSQLPPPLLTDNPALSHFCEKTLLSVLSLFLIGLNFGKKVL